MTAVERFARDASGALVVTMHESETAVLAQLLQEVRLLVSSPADGNRATARLFPRAYLDPTEDGAEGEWQATVHPDLVQHKIAAIDAALALLARVEPDPRADELVRVALAPDEEQGLLGAVNDIRLALGSMLQVTGDRDADDEEYDDDPFEAGQDVGDDPDDPEGDELARRHQHRVLFEWLGLFEEDLVGVLLSEMPE